MNSSVASSSTESCCLCNNQLQASKGKGKHKKFNGSGCVVEREIIRSYLLELNLSLAFEGNITICYSCCLKLKKIKKLEEDLRNLRSEIQSFLKKCHGSLVQQQFDVVRNRSPANFEGTSGPTKVPKRSTPFSALRASPECRFVVRYPRGDRTYKLTPQRAHLGRKLIRKSFPSFTKSVVEKFSEHTVISVCGKVRKELQHLCSASVNSVLKNDENYISEFNWDVIWSEFCNHLPTLTSVFVGIINDSPTSKPIICLMISMILKRRNKKMSLVQRVMSLYFYGNGVNKQVYRCLQPLMLCLSHEGTIKVIDRSAKNYNATVCTWRDSLLSRINDDIQDSEQCNNSSGASLFMKLGWMPPNDHNDEVDPDFNSYDLTCDLDLLWCTNDEIDENDGNETEYSSDSDVSFSAPPYSPLQLDTETLPESDKDVLALQDCPGVSTGIESCDTTDQSLTLTPNVETTVAVSSNDTVCSPGDLASAWCGYKVVIDNVDKNIHPSFQRFDNATSSNHWIHGYAVLDRLDFSAYSDIYPTSPIDVKRILINDQDVAQLEDDSIVLMARILEQHMDKFSSGSKSVNPYIMHKYTKEMSAKSQVVPLGVFEENENKIDEMCKAMDKLHEYVPTKLVVTEKTLVSGEVKRMEDYAMYKNLIGGDQLTVARVRGSAAARVDHQTKKDRLEGFVPVVEDWHAKQCLLKVIWVLLFKSDLTSEKGTLPQLKVLINCSGNLDPSKNMKGCEDFLLTVLHAHVVAASKYLIRISSTCESFKNPEDISREIVTRFVNFDPNVEIATQDKMHLYSLQVLTLGLVWHGFNDSLKQGDGDRILTYWKFFLVIFKAGKRHNYCKEAINLLLQYHFLLPKRLAEQMKWSRCINTRGVIGGNIPSDLHLEHLNRRFKNIISNLQSNVTSKVIIRASRSIGLVHNICQTFEQQNGARKKSGKHTRPSFKKECQLISEQLEEQNVFEMLETRCPSSLKYIKCLIQDCPTAVLEQWIPTKVTSYKW